MNNREIHYRYVLGILLLVLVLLVTLQYFEVPDLVDKFEFALTLSSLLLALLAIFYTIVSATNQDAQLAKLIETNAQIGSATGEIQVAAREISDFAKEAPRQFDRLGVKIDSMHGSFDSLSDTESNAVEARADSDPIDISEVQFEKLFLGLQFGAMKVLYLFERFQYVDKNIPLEKLEELGLNSPGYVGGCLTVFEAIGLVEFRIHADEIIVIRCSEVVRENVDPFLTRVINVVDRNTADDLRLTKERVDEFTREEIQHETSN